MIKPEDVIIEQVSGTRWVVAYHPSSPYIMFDPELPPYASPELAQARRDFLIAVVNRQCHHCGAVAVVPPNAKIYPEAPQKATTKVIHDPGCVCTEESLDRLEMECSPSGELERWDVSDETTATLADWYHTYQVWRSASFTGRD